MSIPASAANHPGDRGHLLTEQANPRSAQLDQLSPLELVDLFNPEDQRTLEAIAAAREPLAQAIATITTALRQGVGYSTLGRAPAGGWGCWMRRNVHPPFAPHQISCRVF